MADLLAELKAEREKHWDADIYFSRVEDFRHRHIPLREWCRACGPNRPCPTARALDCAIVLAEGMDLYAGVETCLCDHDTENCCVKAKESCGHCSPSSRPPRRSSEPSR